MATVIERPRDRVVEDRTFYSSDNSAGWAIALVVLAVLAVIAFMVWPSIAQRAAPVAPSTIQVNVPEAAPVAPVQSTLPVDNGSTPVDQP